MHHVCCDCLAPQYWEYYPNIRLHYIGHPVTVVTSGELRNQNLAAVWGLTKGALNAPGQLWTIYRHREHMLAHGLTGLVHSYKSRTI